MIDSRKSLPAMLIRIAKYTFSEDQFECFKRWKKNKKNGFLENLQDLCVFFCFWHKMEPLDLNKRVFQCLNIYPVAKQLMNSTKYLHPLIAIGMIIIECAALMASILFIFFYLKSDIEKCLYALFQVAALFSVIYMWIVGYILRNTMVEIFTKFQKIYDSSIRWQSIEFLLLQFELQNKQLIVHRSILIFTGEQSSILFQYLNEANRRTIWITNLLVRYVPVMFIGLLVVMATINVAYCEIVYGQINVDLLYFPYYFV